MQTFIELAQQLDAEITVTRQEIQLEQIELQEDRDALKESRRRVAEREARVREREKQVEYREVNVSQREEIAHRDEEITRMYQETIQARNDTDKSLAVIKQRVVDLAETEAALKAREDAVAEKELNYRKEVETDVMGKLRVKLFDETK